MASSTPNINLTLPVGSETVSRQIINDNNTKIDTAIGAVPSGTDLQSQVNALNNKMFPSGEGTNVLTATDFNTMVEIKNYFISTNSVAAACANRSCNTAGKLCVWTINGNSFDQTWQYGGQIYYAIDGKVYQRTVGTNGSKQLSFGSWQELALKSETEHISFHASPAQGATTTISKEYRMVAISRFYNGANKSALYMVDFSGTAGAITSTFSSAELTVSYNTSSGWSIKNVSAGGNIQIDAFDYIP